MVTMITTILFAIQCSHVNGYWTGVWSAGCMANRVQILKSLLKKEVKEFLKKEVKEFLKIHSKFIIIFQKVQFLNFFKKF